MKKINILLILSFLVQGVFATKHDHHDEYAVRYIKDHQQINPVLQQQLRNGIVWQSFIADHPDWYVSFDENNQKPHRAFGAPIPLVGGSIEQKTMQFVTNDLSGFGIPSDLRFNQQNKNDKYIHLDFTQYYNDIEVINSRLYFKLTTDEYLVSFGLDVFSDIAISTVPTLSTNDAIAAAAINIIPVITHQKVEEELKILPVPAQGKYVYHLVYEVYLETKIEQGPAHYICYVDAHTGKLLMRKNKVLYEAPPMAISSVVGDLYTTHPYNPSSVEKLKYLRAKDPATGQSYYADANGDITIPLAIGTQIRYKLEGLYADVQTNSNTPDIYANLAATNTITFDNSNSTIQERTAYYAVNEVHDHMKNIFPTFTGLDSPMETNVDESGTCNAYFAGSSINFYEEGLAANGTDYCEATARIVDVVYHEYGHAINANRYNSGSGMWNGALHEGYADIWAFTITEDPILGIGFYQNNPTGFVRRYDQDIKVYPQDLVGEVHADGEIIAGAFWDTYLNLNSMQQTIDLFKYTFDSGVDGADGTEGVIFTDILVEVLFADDNDADITNGTPNDLAIVQAFAKHGITLLSNAVINHNPVTTSGGNTAITIAANVSVTYPWALANANCYYRINKDTNWATVPMTASGSSMQAQLPAQPNGTIIAYYIALEDVYGYFAGITPMASHLSPIQHANLPNFIMVGYNLMEEEDFDFNVGFWQLGAANDNATTGMWEIGTPIGSFDDPANLSGIVQTNTQHTPGGSECAFTGNAASIFDGIGTNDVDDGHTTLLSPYYDLTAYDDPAFSYWRWYTNSPSSGANPGADWWQVLITDDGTNWHYVENNLSSDISWRKMAFRVKDYVNLTSSVQLKFIASDSIHLGQNLDGGSLIEAAVDDLYLYEADENTTDVLDVIANKPKLMRITDMLGRTVDPATVVATTTLFYLFDDGTVEKRVVNRE